MKNNYKLFIILLSLFSILSINLKAVNLMRNDTCEIHILPTNDTSIATNDEDASFQVTTDREAAYYHWYPFYGISDTTIRNPILTIDNGDERTYFVQAYLVDSNYNNLIFNGDFSLGDSGFTSSLTLSPNLANSNTYNVGTTPDNFYWLLPSCSNGGNMMICNAGGTTTDQVIYQKDIVVEANTYYVMSFEAANINPSQVSSAPPSLQLSINNNNVGNSLVCDTGTCVWKHSNNLWFSGNTHSCSIKILNNLPNSTSYFLLDNISLRKACVAIDSIHAIAGECFVHILPTTDTTIVSRTHLTLQLNVQEDATSYVWTPSDGLSNDSIRNPILNLDTNTTAYYQLVASYETDSNLIYNGDFSHGNEGFFSSLTYVSSPGSQALWPETTYAIGTNPNSYHQYFNNCTHDGNMLIANGAVTPNVNVYRTQVIIEPGTDYIFSCEATNVAQANSVLARLQFSINGEQLGPIFTPTSTPCQWNRFYQIWHNDNATTAEIKILNQNTNADGNDFALDNIVFRKICKAYSTITIHVVDSLPPVYDTIYKPICQNSYPVHFRDSIYTQPGTYHYNIPTSSISIADSFFTIIVSTLPIYDDTIRAMICQGQTYTDNGFIADTSGVYVNDYTTEAGCDSITTLILTVNPVYNDTITETICGNENYHYNGFNENESGFYTHNFTTKYGCDSIVNLNLTVIPIIDTTIYDTIIYGTIFNKYNYNAIDSGVYVFYYKFNQNDDCPKRVTLYLSVIIPEQVQVWFPNSFTPTANTNNTFGYMTGSDKFVLQEFQIYNRWGSEVFSSTKQGEFWDGKYKGQVCDMGEYIYHLLYRTKVNGDCVYQKKGTFFLLR